METMAWSKIVAARKTADDWQALARRIKVEVSTTAGKAYIVRCLLKRMMRVREPSSMPHAGPRGTGASSKARARAAGTTPAEPNSPPLWRAGAYARPRIWGALRVAAEGCAALVAAVCCSARP